MNQFALVVPFDPALAVCWTWRSTTARRDRGEDLGVTTDATDCRSHAQTPGPKDSWWADTWPLDRSDWLCFTAAGGDIHVTTDVAV